MKCMFIPLDIEFFNPWHDTSNTFLSNNLQAKSGVSRHTKNTTLKPKQKKNISKMVLRKPGKCQLHLHSKITSVLI